MKQLSPNSEAWLILAHCFNMDGRAASQTITDRLPLLMERGVMPVALSAPMATKDRRFPHYRLISLAPSGILFEMRHILRARVRNRVLLRILKTILASVCLPLYAMEALFIRLDSQWSWFFGASVLGFFLTLRYRPGIIYSTAGPPSTHVAGLILHKLTGIPWLAEIHDPLIYDSEKPKGQNYAFKKWLEKVIFGNASAVIYFTNQALANAAHRTGIGGKGYVVRPGAKPPDFLRVKYEPGDKIHFGHFGSLAGNRNVGLVVQALHELIDEKPSWGNLICLDIFGAELDSVSRKSLKDFSLDGIVVQHGRLEYDPETGKSGRQRALDAMCRSDVLLLLHGDYGAMCDEYIPSKLYEYLLTGRPILGLVWPNTEMEEVLESQGHVVVCSTELGAIKRGIRGFVEAWECGIGVPAVSQALPFSVEATVEQLMKIAASIKKEKTEVCGAD